MKTKKISTAQTVELINMFNLALFAQPRLERIAKLLINKKEKIYAMLMEIFNLSNDYNFFGTKILSCRWDASDNSVKNCPADDPMTTEQALYISKIFSQALCFPYYSKTEAAKIIGNPNKFKALVNDLFEMSPAFNLFEYRLFIRAAPLTSFKEVCTWNGDILIVCTADEVCEPFGFKSGDRVYSPKAIAQSYQTVIGVAPFKYDNNETPLALWTAGEAEKFKYPNKCVVGGYTNRNLKESGVIKLCHG